MSVIVRAVLAGKIAPLGRHGVPSGIDKRPVDGPIAITFTGLSGDAQGDSRHHGGPEKAVHHYPFDHYAHWRAEHPDLAWRLAQPGAFGENISTDGLIEADVCIGDIYRLGTALVQVSQGRQPCWRLNERFDDPRMARRVQERGRTGWYYRVLEAGHVAAGDMISLVECPAEGWTLERVLHVLHRDTLNAESLARLAELPQLAASWRDLARRRLDSRAVENWSRRLETPEGAVS
jgi:MOSC domain-containing protein YiiM